MKIQIQPIEETWMSSKKKIRKRIDKVRSVSCSPEVNRDKKRIKLTMKNNRHNNNKSQDRNNGGEGLDDIDLPEKQQDHWDHDCSSWAKESDDDPTDVIEYSEEKKRSLTGMKEGFKTCSEGDISGRVCDKKMGFVNERTSSTTHDEEDVRDGDIDQDQGSDKNTPLRRVVLEHQETW